MIEYIVWIGGMEQGHYSSEDDAYEVAAEWVRDGYDDVQVEEVDSETPEETNAWLRSGGY